MVQVIPRGTPRGPSVGQRLSAGIGQGLQVGSQLMQEHVAQKQQQQQRMAAKELGMDPRILDLPMEAQAAYFKSQFAPEKSMTPLQESQQKLAEERLKNMQEQTALFKSLSGEQEPSELEGMPAESKKKLSMYPEENLTQLAGFAGQPGQMGVIGNMAKAEIDRREKEKTQDFKTSEQRRSQEFELIKPVIAELNQARKNIPLQEQAIEDIINAAPDVGALDYFADVTGFEPMRTAAGAKMKTAIKDFFLSDLTRAGARPNQWIEQQLADALVKIGRDKESNLTIAEGMKFKVDLLKKRVEILDDLIEKDLSKGGYRADVDARAYKLMKPYVEERKKDLQDNIRKIQSSKKSFEVGIRMMSPDGTLYEILPEDVEEAEKHGFQHAAGT